MKKKRILIVNNNMHIGGVQRALVNLLKCVHAQYDITVVLFNENGDLRNEIPDDVCVIPVRSAYQYLGMIREDIQGKPAPKLMRSFYAAICRLLGRNAAIFLMSMGQKTLSGYDAAISYLHDADDRLFYGGCNDFVLRHVQASRKYTVLHCDYENSGANTESNHNRYAQFDCIAACSEGCRSTFVKALPDLAERAMVVCNCHDYETVQNKAVEAAVQLPENRLNIITVARLGKEKGVIRAIEAFSRLRKLNSLYHYYIVGDGIERAEIEAFIQKNALEKTVTLVGELVNPYGYMKAADLLLIPSMNEAAPLVINEAACLGMPVLSTHTTSAIDMVEKTGYGWVCENSIDGICEALQRVIEDASLVAEKKRYLADQIFDNSRATAEFEDMINSNGHYD